jgi:ADP-ribose pyrophosphatase
MTETTWRVLSRRTVFQGGPVKEIAIETVQLPDGRVIDDYYSILLGDYVLVYPEMEDGTIRMLRQYRHGLRRSCIGFPGGALEPRESPVDAARRELFEELGCAAVEWSSLGTLTTNGNQGCNRAYLFRATGCRQVAPPSAPDIERPDILTLRPHDLLGNPNLLDEIGLASHVALLLAATHPQLAARASAARV